MKGSKQYQAFLFDLNGTMIDDMHYHIQAWHKILNDLGAGISMERMKAECYGKNHELLERIFPNRFSYEEKDKMSYEKEKQYQAKFKPHLQLIKGLHPFMTKAKAAGIKMAIGSAAIMYNIDFVLNGLNIRHLIDAIVSADDVTHSKPHPETFLNCARLLQIPPQSCLVFEDAPKGAEAAYNAGMDSIVITTMHTKDEFNQQHNIIDFIKDYDAPLLQNIISN